MKKSLFRGCVIIICGLAVCQCNQLYKEEGEFCTKDGNEVCTLLHKCPSAINDVKMNKRPKICKFKDIEPIVCCNADTIIQTKQPHKAFCEKYTAERNRLLPPGFIDINLINNYGRTQYRSKRQIYNGEEASSGEFPYMAHIGYTNNNEVIYLCGGSLISEQFVLTAGHCLYDQEFGAPQHVRLGDLNVIRDDDNAMPQNYSIVEQFLHPGYSSRFYNDIGLLRLHRRITITKYVIPACLYDKFEINTTKVLAAGWGDVGYLENPSDHLLKVELGWYSTEMCNETYKDVVSNKSLSRGIVSEWQICASGIDEIRDTCGGDSGGPLQIFDENKMFTIVGITSMGKPCGTTLTPGIYTRVSAYVQWIENIVWKI